MLRVRKSASAREVSKCSCIILSQSPWGLNLKDVWGSSFSSDVAVPSVVLAARHACHFHFSSTATRSCLITMLTCHLTLDRVSLILPLMMVFSMEVAAGAPMELGLSLLLFALNGILSSSDVVSVIGWLSTNYLKKDPTVQSEAPSKPRVEEAMQRLTEENFLIASHFLQHAMLLAVIMYVGMGSPAFAGLCFLFYATFLLIAKGYVRMTSRRVKIYLIVNYITFIPVMFAGDLFAAVGRKEVLDQITSAYRFVLVVLCVDSNLHIPSQVAVSLAQAGPCKDFLNSSLKLCAAFPRWLEA